MSRVFDKSEYSPGDFGRELRALAEANQSLNENLADLKMESSTVREFRNAVNEHADTLKEWQGRLGEAVATEAIALKHWGSDPKNTDQPLGHLRATYGHDQLSILVGLLDEKLLETGDRRYVIKFISEMGVAAIGALPALRNCFANSENGFERDEIASIVAHMDHSAVNELIDILKFETELALRISAAQALSFNNPKVIDALMEAFRCDKSDGVRMTAACSLSAIALSLKEPAEKKLIDTLVEAMSRYSDTDAFAIYIGSALQNIESQGELK